MSERPGSESIYPIGKIIIGVTWLFATASFFPPLETTAAGGFGRMLQAGSQSSAPATCDSRNWPMLRKRS